MTQRSYAEEPTMSLLYKDAGERKSKQNEVQKIVTNSYKTFL